MIGRLVLIVGWKRGLIDLQLWPKIIGTSSIMGAKIASIESVAYILKSFSF